jgi:ubiquinone/menaquinone biosynthesis C-methylase UbiE
MTSRPSQASSRSSTTDVTVGLNDVGLLPGGLIVTSSFCPGTREPEIAVMKGSEDLCPGRSVRIAKTRSGLALSARAPSSPGESCLAREAMIGGVERYVIRGGQQGYDRLQLLARERWPDTSALFERVGLGPGMRCIDLGCGGGEVSFEIARLVGPDGCVTGVDMDEIKLSLARQAGADRGARNVEFRAINVNDWNESAAYDIVYCRALLHHLSHPVDLLRRMWASVRPGGAIVVEDADFDGWFCHPPNEGFAFFLRAYSQVVARRGGDHATGRKLHAHFMDVGIPDPSMNLVQRLHLADEGKKLALSTLDATAEAILAEGIASETEVNEALSSLAQFTNDPETLIGGPRIFQLWSRREVHHPAR